MEAKFHEDDDEASSNTVEFSTIQTSCASNLPKKRQATYSSTKGQKRSHVWTVFDKLDPEELLMYQAKHHDNKERARCKLCGAVLIGGSVSGTTPLRRHMERCKKKNLPVENVNENKNFDTRIAREMIAQLVIAHGYPFKIVEDDKFNAFLSYLNNGFKPVCRNVCKADCFELHTKMKEKVKSSLEKVSSNISLSATLWTSCTSDKYLCLTAQFIDDDWKLRSLILNFQHVPPPYTAIDLFDKIYRLLVCWGIERQIFSITLDNASDMNEVGSLLMEDLKLAKALICDGKFFHIRCAAHILDFVAEKSLLMIKEPLEKVRESFKYIEGSDTRARAFRDCVNRLNLNYSRGLWLDVATKWNSTYLMLEKFIYFSRAFEIFSYSERDYKALPTRKEFLRMKKVSCFLRPFYEFSTLFSRRDYPTSKLYFEVLLQIEENIQDMLVAEDPDMIQMKKSMGDEFRKDWDDYSMVLSFAPILDPNKLKYLEFELSELDPACENKWEDVLKEFKLLFKVYESRRNFLSQSSMVIDDAEQNVPTKDQDLTGCNNNATEPHSHKSELDVYLAGPMENIAKELDVLEYWKQNQHLYPTLSLMARDILSIPFTTVFSESAFSMGNRVIDEFRNCLKPENAEILMITRNWLYGYKVSVDPNSEDEDEVLELGRSIWMPEEN